MNAAALASLLFIGVAASPNQSPFDRYLTAVHHHRIEASESAFLKKCGVDASGAKRVLGVGDNGSWRRTNDPSKAMSHLETDFFNTVEVWSQNGQARVVNFWALELDVGSENNTTYSLDAAGRIQFAQSTNAYTPTDGGPGGWTYRQQLQFDDQGTIVRKTGSFINERGEPIPNPKLDADGQKNFDWVPDKKVIVAVKSQLRPDADPKKSFGP
jgi:hypothetical protein